LIDANDYKSSKDECPINMKIYISKKLIVNFTEIYDLDLHNLFAIIGND